MKTILDPVENKPLQEDWRKGQPKDVGIWQVLLEDTLFGARVHTATFRGWTAHGRDILVIGGCMSWNIPRILAYRKIPDIYINNPN